VDDDDLFDRARRGDRAAWREIVDRCSSWVWCAIRRYRLQEADAEDAYASAYCRLVEHIDEIREPGAVCAWLATTARRECERILARRSPVVDPADAGHDVPDPGDEPHEIVERLERSEQVARALAMLSDTCRRLLEALSRPSEPTYGEISLELGMPHGSIGPTRQRCLAKLDQILREA
jgi:RNA polymerase sigma factor (sigma-70 family)